MAEDDTAEVEALEDYLRNALQEALNRYPGDSGPTLLGDWMIILEGHTSEGTHLRIMDPDLTFWRRLGLAGFAVSQAQAEMTGNVAWAASQPFIEEDDDGEGSNA